jgi:hypothetical protein
MSQRRQLPSGRLPLTLPTIGRGQREHQQGPHHRYPHGPLGFPGRIAQVSLLCGFLATTVLVEVTVVIVITRLQGLVDAALIRNSVLPPGPQSRP